MLSALFSARAVPLFGQAERFELGPLPADVAAEYVAGRFEETGRGVGGPCTRWWRGGRATRSG
ncbi:MAG TPA: hypothetical protein VHM89_04205 [Acidimicrobiales bacterium]|nr:hypothetical protein [Acidimicrobiales bacterium]